VRPRRIYLPLTHDQLRALAADRRLAAPLQGYAAGSPGRVDARISPAAAQEEAEYLAFVAASEHATSLTAGERRVIASADVAPVVVRQSGADEPGGGPVAVLLGDDVPLRAVVSLHVDELVDDAVGDDDDSQDVDTLPDLLWYDITELDAVLDDLGLEH
jgi:hypothetical protein